MRILIVDDNAERMGQLVPFVVGCGIDRGCIDVESSGIGARDQLSRYLYDLVIIDVMLPFRAEEQPSHTSAVALLTEISETNNLRKPRYILGLTAFDEIEQRISPEFSQRAWLLLRTSDLNQDWLMTVGNAVRYIREQTEAAGNIEYENDLAVITALRSEMSAVHKLPWNWRAEEPLDDSQFVAKGFFWSGDKQRSVISAVASGMGMVATAVLAAKLITHFRPRVIAMPGICAGLRERTGIGDVICADMSWNYQSGKHTQAGSAVPGFEIDPHFIQVDPSLAAKWDQLSLDQSLLTKIWQDWPIRPSAPPRALRGPVASGSAVLADAALTAQIRLQQRKLLGVEMELYGLYLAARQAGRPRPLVIGMKAVCDFADVDKHDGEQPYAAYVSASAMGAFFERYMAGL